MILIKSLTKTSTEILYRAFLNAFSDYTEPVNSTFAEFKYLLERRGYTPLLSFGAFAGDLLVGFTLNAIAQWNNKLTAYDTGTGIIKEFRNQGIATQIFNESVPLLQQEKVRQYLLEVIKTNDPAVRLYKNAGFKITRVFNYYIAAGKDFIFREFKTAPIVFKEIENPDWAMLCSFWDFEPSWQNSVAAIKRKKDYLTITGVWYGNVLAGYGIVEKHSGDIPQIAIRKEYRRKGIATLLLKYLVSQIATDQVSIINTPADYQPFNRFAQSVNLNPGDGQYEMMLDLDAF
jgi:ribosomal protein S18 acetylase RimI-like enzyme